MNNPNPHIEKSIERYNLKDKIYCNKCSIEILHSSVSRVALTYRGDDEPTFWITYHIIQCNGCETISFMESHNNSENIIDYGDDEKFGKPDVIFFPERLQLNKQLVESKTLPNNIKEIYNETISLISKGMFRFAALGLRLIIEEWSKDNGATKYRLKSKIKELHDSKIISDTDKDVLEALKELGDDAAHKNIIQPDKIIGLSLKIVESLLIKFYIIEEQKLEFENNKKLFFKSINQ